MIPREKVDRYELLLIKGTWICLAAGFAYVFLTRHITVGETVGFSKKPSGNMALTVLLFASVFLLHFLYYLLMSRGRNLKIDRWYLPGRITALVLYAFMIAYLNVGLWIYIIIAFAIVTTSLARGLKWGLILVSCSFSTNMAAWILVKLTDPSASNTPAAFLLQKDFLLLVYLHIVLLVFSILCGKIGEDTVQRDEENMNLVNKLKEKYALLTQAQEEIKIQYERLKETNLKLEEANEKLSERVAEFYTLQQVSQAIGSILDIKELLKFVNDMIIGVMGVSFSTVILYDEKKDRLKVQTTNITNLEDLTILEGNVNNPALMDVLSHNRPLVENTVDPFQYSFVQGRDVKSMVCIPLSTKSRKRGLVLIEHTYLNAFEDSNIRLLDIIGQQVGIAIENAELYQKMQDLANKDGLTGLYNRLYFQDMLEKEFNYALLENYPLSLAIFDIDFFKRFNDTFGHLFGDKVLKLIVDSIQPSLRKSDIFARFGGEEFIILFPRTDLAAAYERVESLRQIVSKTPIRDELVTAYVTVSFGISCFPDCSTNENELLRTADDALYDAKASGRNIVKIAPNLND